MFLGIEFGNGNVVVGTTELGGRHGVIISPVEGSGELSDKLPLQDGTIFWFPTKEHAERVRVAIMTRE